jgi:hypothetical protein
MGWGSMLGKAVGFAVKHGPKVGKALGQISEGGKKFGTILDGGRKFGSLINDVSGGKIASSKFGQNVSKLADKADAITGKVSSIASQGEGKVGEAIQKLQNI